MTTIAAISLDAAALTPATQWHPAAARDLLERESWAEPAEDVRALLTPTDAASLALAAGRVAEAAVVLGAGERAISLAVEYAKVRQQFGSPIGAFQAVKHLLAEARTGLAFAEPLVIAAALAVDAGSLTATRDAAIALRSAAAAAEQAVRTAIQVHGGIGYTDELPLGRLLTAVVSGQQAWGGRARLIGEITSALDAGAPHVGEPSLQVTVA